MPIVLRPLAERSSLPTRLSDVGAARKTARVLAGGFGVLTVLVAGVTAGVVLDAALGTPALVRAGVLLGTLFAAGVLFLRDVWKPLRQQVHPLHVAQLLEARFPRLNDSLASAVDFLTSAETGNTSARFQRIAVIRAQRALEKCDTSRLIPSGRAWQQFWLAAVVVGVSAGLAVWKPGHAATGLVRAADPFGVHPWPTKTQIDITNPSPDKFPVRAAIGDPFEVRFTLKGVIPDHATVAVQLDNGVQFEETIPIEEGEPTRKEVELVAVLEPHRIPTGFKFQLRANDAATPWHTVVLAPPPKLVPLDGRPSPQMHVTFPAYTDLPALPWPDGNGSVWGVHGTRVRLTAATDRPVVSAVLIPQGERAHLRLAASVAPLATVNPLAAFAVQPLADLAHADIPVTVTDGTRLSVDFIPRVAGQYLLKFTDDTGLSGTRSLTLDISPDPAPEATLFRPAVGKDPLILLPTARTTVHASGDDGKKPLSYALKGIAIEYRVGGTDAPYRTLPIVSLERPPVPTPALGLAGGLAVVSPPKQTSAEATVTLPITAFVKSDGSRPADGDRITLRAAATDFDDVSVLKEPGRSQEVTILVVSRPALDTTLQQELAKLRPTLLKVREQQRQVRERTEEVQKAAGEGKMTADDGIKLTQAEGDQRGVRNEVTDPEGLVQAADLLLETIRANDVPRSTTTERVETLASDLKRLAERELDPIEPLIASAKQQADSTTPDAKKAADDLRKAVGRQKAAEANLDGMLKLLEQWGGAGEVKAEARALKDLLGKAGDKARAAADQVDPGKPATQLTQKEKAELDKAAEQFEQLSARADATIQKAQRLADEKAAKAADLKAQADAKAAEAVAARAEAGKQPPGSPAAAEAKAKADKLAAEAADLKAQAAQAQTEADALRNAVRDAGNQGLKEDLQTAGDKLRQNNPAESLAAQKSAADRLDAVAGALSEKQTDPMEELKKRGETADEAFKLEQQQDELRQKVKEAEKIEDPQRREEELKKLARQQEDLQKKAEDLLERLTREREDAAADKLREAIEKMEAAKQDLEQGKAPKEQEEQALDKLKETTDKLDQQKEMEEQKLGREKQRELAEQLKALRDRLKAADDEAGRIQAAALKRKEWPLSLEKSLRDLGETVAAVGEEVQAFADKELEPLPVYKRLATQSATQSAAAAKRIGERQELIKEASGDPFDPVAEAAADDRSRRPLKTAIRRLNHILDSLVEDPKRAQPPKPMDQPGGGGGDMPGDMGQGGPQPNGVQPLAQLKALRSIQAELNTRTRDFEAAHPDKAKLTEADREELEELERSQREVAELFDKLKDEFEKLKSQQEPKLP